MSSKFRSVLQRQPVMAVLAKAVLAGAAALTFATVTGLTSASASTHAHSGTTHNWIETGWDIHLSDHANASLSKHFFNTPGSFGTGLTPGSNPISDGYRTSAVLDYTSYAQFASDIHSGAITYPYHWVMYDPEDWSRTPLAEQQNPAKYMRMFGNLAHANGLQVIMAPGRDLGLASGVCPKAHETLDQWYVNCDIAGAAASSADVVLVQDQVDTGNTSKYDWLFDQARHQALTANSHVSVDTELSTNYGSAGQMAAAAKSVNASGYYICATSGSIGQADQFLQQMENAGY
jgi:hypothetical protein